MLVITELIQIPEQEITFVAIRAQGPGGQHVNKVSSAILLKFDLLASSLPQDVKDRLAQLKDRRISKDGVITIKAQKSRNQLQNRRDAFERLKEMILKALKPEKTRRPTTHSKASIVKRIEHKKQRSVIKTLRKKVEVN